VSAGQPGPRRVAVRAPAKLNLGLRVAGRRADGYHELDSLFVPIDWADDLVLEVAPAPAPRVALELEAGAIGVPAGGENLAARAALAFLERAGLSLSAAIRLTKRIPAAAGLGGGSSDAGAALRALSELCPGALAPVDLAELALSLGADVPFFLDPRPARVRGIGERIEPLADVAPMDCLLLHPGLSLSTAEVYRAFDALTPAGATPAPAQGLAAAGAIDLSNDLEAAAVRLCPPVARLRERLRSLSPVGIGMSGSGPTLFGIFPSAEAAAAAGRDLALEAPAWARVARSLGSG